MNEQACAGLMLLLGLIGGFVGLAILIGWGWTLLVGGIILFVLGMVAA